MKITELGNNLVLQDGTEENLDLMVWCRNCGSYFVLGEDYKHNCDLAKIINERELNKKEIEEKENEEKELETLRIENPARWYLVLQEEWELKQKPFLIIKYGKFFNVVISKISEEINKNLVNIEQGIYEKNDQLRNEGLSYLERRLKLDFQKIEMVKNFRENFNKKFSELKKDTLGNFLFQGDFERIERIGIKMFVKLFVL